MGIVQLKLNKYRYDKSYCV